MMHILAAGLVAIGASLVLTLIAKATFIILGALLVTRLLRRKRAAVRHLVLVAAFAVLALLPVATAVMPALPVAVGVQAGPAAVSRQPARLRLASDAAMFVAAGSPQLQAGRQSWPTLSISALLVALWLAGAIGSLVRVAMGLHRV